MQRLTSNHWMDLRDSHGRVGGRIEVPEGDINSKGKTTISTNLDPLVFSETEPKRINGLDPGALHICTRSEAQLSCGYLNNWSGDHP